MKTLLFTILTFLSCLSYSQVYQSPLVVDGQIFSISVPEGYTQIENSFSPQTTIYAQEARDTVHNLNNGPLPGSLMISFSEYPKYGHAYFIDDDFFTTDIGDYEPFEGKKIGDGHFMLKLFKIENPDYTTPQMFVGSTIFNDYELRFFYTPELKISEKEGFNFLEKWFKSFKVKKSGASSIEFKKETELNHFLCDNIPEHLDFIFDYPTGKKQWVETNDGNYLKSYEYGDPDGAIEMSLFIVHMGDTTNAKFQYTINNFWNKRFPNHILIGIEYLNHTIGDHMTFDEYMLDPRFDSDKPYNKVENLCAVEFMGHYFVILVERTGNESDDYKKVYYDFLYSLHIEKKNSRL